MGGGEAWESLSSPLPKFDFVLWVQSTKHPQGTQWLTGSSLGEAVTPPVCSVIQERPAGLLLCQAGSASRRVFAPCVAQVCPSWGRFALLAGEVFLRLEQTFPHRKSVLPFRGAIVPRKGEKSRIRNRTYGARYLRLKNRDAGLFRCPLNDSETLSGREPQGGLNKIEVILDDTTAEENERQRDIVQTRNPDQAIDVCGPGVERLRPCRSPCVMARFRVDQLGEGGTGTLVRRRAPPPLALPPLRPPRAHS